MIFGEADAFLRAVVRAPADPAARLVWADWLLERGALEEEEALRAGRVFLNWEDKRAASALAACRFAPASFDKRFAREVCGPASAGTLPSLTPKQLACLWRLAWKYRRQIKDPELVRRAEWLTR